MKKHGFAVLLCCLLLLTAVFGFASAVAEEEIAEQIELDLFTGGKFPEYAIMRTYSTEGLFDYIYQELTNMTASISLRDYELDSATAKAYFADVINSSPELFFVSTDATIYRSSSTQLVTRLVPQYRFTAEELPAKMEAFNAHAAEIAAYAQPADTDLGKLLRINDYFCANFEYDGDDPHYRPDQLFDTGRGVCQSYMLGYAAVLDVLGIENTHASSESMNHTWNMVCLDENWYHVDVTWNDPVTDMPLRACHTNFLLSDEGITNNSHSDWVSSEIAISTTYDSFFWKDIFTPLACTGASVYYLDPEIENGTRTINCWNMESGSTTAMHEFSIVNSDGTYSYYANYRPIATDGMHVFYAACGRLMALPLSGGSPVQVFSTGNEAQRIYSLWRQDNAIYMLAGETLNSAQVLSFSLKTMELDSRMLRLKPGESAQLSAYIFSSPDAAASVSWTSSNPDCISVDSQGMVSALGCGAALVQATHADGPQAECIVAAHNGNLLTLPSDTLEIAESAFENTGAGEIILPEGLQSIGDCAFADSAGLALVNIPESLSTLSETAFQNCENISLLCSAGSPWADYAADLGIPCIIAE